MQNRYRTMLIATLALAVASCARIAEEDPLPSWHDGASRSAIVDYVQSVTTPGTAAFIPVAERIAVFDNDGTLWAEQPIYFQLAFALSRLAQLAPQHPEWADDQDFTSALSGDPARIRELDREGLLKIVMATHSGMANRDFHEIVQTWMKTAAHPVSGRPFSRMIYQPMRELLDYLRNNDFSVYIVSGGGREFMRAFAEGVYGVPPENVVGTMFGLEFSGIDGTIVLHRKADIAFINDGPGKPVGIQRAIGRRPVFAFGNSDGDLQMLQWTDASPHLSFQGIVHHTDTDREWAYDRESDIGHLDQALDQALQDGWTVVDMKSDWARVFPPAD